VERRALEVVPGRLLRPVDLENVEAQQRRAEIVKADELALAVAVDGENPALPGQDQVIVDELQQQQTAGGEQRMKTRQRGRQRRLVEEMGQRVAQAKKGVERSLHPGGQLLHGGLHPLHLDPLGRGMGARFGEHLRREVGPGDLDAQLRQSDRMHSGPAGRIEEPVETVALPPFGQQRPLPRQPLGETGHPVVACGQAAVKRRRLIFIGMHAYPPSPTPCRNSCGKGPPPPARSRRQNPSF